MASFIYKKFFGTDGSRAFVIAVVLSCIYYTILHQPFMKDSVLHAYTAHHATEYAIVVLFFWANAELFLSFLRTGREQASAQRQWLPKRNGVENAEEAGNLLTYLREKNADAKQTMMFGRIQAALTFVHERKSAAGFREYLDSLATRDEDFIHAKYSFSRFVTTILPIVGLIGTVVHFGAALTGLSMDGLAEKIPGMLSGMGTAFNTTFSAMSGMAITTLVRFLVERRDAGVLHNINAFIEDELLYRFNTIDASVTPFLDALNESQSTMLYSLGSYEQMLADEWNKRLTSIERRWEEVDKKQNENLVTFLRSIQQQQNTHVQEVKQLNNDLVLAQTLMNDMAKTIAGDGKLLELQERLVENLNILHQSQQLEDVMHELTAAIHLFTARQSTVTGPRLAA